MCESVCVLGEGAKGRKEVNSLLPADSRKPFPKNSLPGCLAAPLLQLGGEDASFFAGGSDPRPGAMTQPLSLEACSVVSSAQPAARPLAWQRPISVLRGRRRHLRSCARGDPRV